MQKQVYMHMRTSDDEGAIFILMLEKQYNANSSIIWYTQLLVVVVFFLSLCFFLIFLFVRNENHSDSGPEIIHSVPLIGLGMPFAHKNMTEMPCQR